MLKKDAVPSVFPIRWRLNVEQCKARRERYVLKNRQKLANTEKEKNETLSTGTSLGIK